LTDQADNAAFVHDAMRAGASQVVSPTLAEDFRVALERVAHQFGLDHHKSRVVAVIGSTEGCGSTTIALNLAAEAATVAKVPTILMETGARLGRLAVLLNLKPHYTTQDLLSAPHLDLSAVRRAAAPVGDNLKVIVGPYQSLGPEPSSDVTLRLVALLRRLADFVVLDLPYTFDEDVFAILAAADDVVVVAEPKIPSVHAAMLVKDALAGRKIAALQHFVVNRYVTDSGGASISQIKDLLGEQHLRLVRNHGAAMLEAANRGVPLRDVDPDSPAREDLVSLLGELLHEPTLAKRCHPDNDWLRPVRRFIRWCTA
jgi:pilus assembly protein CpaE